MKQNPVELPKELQELQNPSQTEFRLPLDRFVRINGLRLHLCVTLAPIFTPVTDTKHVFIKTFRKSLPVGGLLCAFTSAWILFVNMAKNSSIGLERRITKIGSGFPSCPRFELPRVPHARTIKWHRCFPRGLVKSVLGPPFSNQVSQEVEVKTLAPSHNRKATV